MKASKPVAAQPEPTPEPEAPIVPATAKSFETRKTGDFALWLGTPTRVTRRAALLAGMVVLASLWLAYRIGVSSGRGEYVPPSTEGSGPVADGKQKREPGPGRMQGTLAAHEAETQRGSATTEPSKLLGFSIVTYATSDRSLELADKMRKHLAAQLDGTGAFDEWVTKAGKLIVVVGFPQERFEDQEWQDALFAKIRAFPSPEWDRGFTFSKLDKQLIGGLYRPR